MKKISFFVAIAAAASLASCTAQAPKANMKNDVDSLSYMMGITNTQGLDMYMSQQLGVVHYFRPRTYRHSAQLQERHRLYGRSSDWSTSWWTYVRYDEPTYFRK